MENVSSMTSSDRDTISRVLDTVGVCNRYWFDAAVVGHVSRPRLYWTSWEVQNGELRLGDLGTDGGEKSFLRVTNPSRDREPIEEFLDEGVTKVSASPFPTFVRWISRTKPPPDPAGIEGCDSETLQKWERSGFAMPPYQFKREKGVVAADGEERVPNADERERLLGFKSGHTAAFEETRRISFMGNTFHCVVIAYLLATWAVREKYLTVIPDIKEIWRVAKADWPFR